MVDAIRPPEERFAGLADYPFAPRYIEWEGLRMHYVDEGPRDAPVALLLHGEPTWSYLYRHMIPPLVAAGYRCVAPDYFGFGKSDKPVEDAWYTIERHIQSVAHLIQSLDLRDITVVCQDWGGPIGLRQAVDMPQRFARLVILNTWLHHEGFEYSEAIRNWREASQDPARLGGDMPTGRMLANYVQNHGGGDLEAVERAYDAPFTGPGSKGGARRFPWCLPFAQPAEGNAADQQRCYDALSQLGKPAHLIFGDRDRIFTPAWGRAWSDSIPGATFDTVEGAGHFLQESHGEQVAGVMLRRIAGETR